MEFHCPKGDPEIRAACWCQIVATIVRDHRETPRARAPIPQLKPPVNRFSSQDMEHPEEADEFIALVRDLRSAPPRPDQPSNSR